MAAPRGISLLDLLPVPGGSQALLPAEVAGPLERLAVVEHHSSEQAWAFVHHGRVTALSDVADLPALGSFPLKVPGLNAGVPFTLTLWRPAVGTAAADETVMEGEPVGFVLDLLLDDVRLELPGLQGARVINEGLGTGRPARLQRMTGRGAQVALVGGLVLRIASSTLLPPTGGGNPTAGPGDITVQVVDRPDTFNPLTRTGAVFGLRFEPPSFFFGSSDWGMTADRVTVDLSDTYTPPAIADRGQPPSWKGVAVDEAALYFPSGGSFLGDFSFSLRDLVIGDPVGLQGSLKVDFGHPSQPDTAALLSVVQHDGEARDPLTVTFSRDDGVSTVPLRGTDDEVTVSAALTPPVGVTDVHARWTLPDGRRVDGLGTGAFTARVGATATVTASTGTGDDEVVSPPMTIRFTRDSSTPASTFEVHGRLDGVDLGRTLSASGAASTLAGLELRVEPADDSTRWTVGAGPGARQASGSTFTPAPTDAGTVLVSATRGGTTRRVELRVLPAGSAVIGTAAGPVDATGSLIDVTEVLGTFDQHRFHVDGVRSAAAAPATLDGGTLTVPDGVIADVAVARGTADDPDATVAEEPPLATHAQLFYVFAEDALRAQLTVPPTEAATSAPYLAEVSDLHNRAATSPVAEWVRSLPDGTKLLVIGRACNLGPDEFNLDLSRRRAAAAARIIEGFDSERSTPLQITHHSEQEAGPSGAAALRSDIAARHGHSLAELGASPGQYIASWPGPSTSAAHSEANTDRGLWPRPLFRRADVYALLPDPVPADAPREEPAAGPSQRRALVPGTPTPASPPRPRQGDAPDYRVRIIVTWDSPTVTSPGDAIPSLAEVAVEWEGDQVALPQPATGTTDGSGGGDGSATGGGATTTAPVQPLGSPTPSPSGVEIWTLLGRWTHDARSGETTFTLALDKTGSPDGIAAVESNGLAMALALGPALLGSAELDSPEDVGLSLAGLLAAVVLAEAFGKDGRVVLTGVEIQHAQTGLDLDAAASGRDRILVDYVTEIGVDLDLAGLLTIQTADGKPLKLRFTGVGIEWDRSKEGWDAFQFVYEDASIALVDPGSWTIESALGDILRISNPRTGVGSTWLEVDLEFALDLGVVKLTRATVRATFSESGLSLELRGLAAEVDVPGVLTGSGRVQLSGGAFRAGIDVAIVPLNAKAQAALAYDPAQGFFFLQVGVVFPAGIPLGGSGIGIFGGVGRFVVNGTRELGPVPGDARNLANADIVTREVGWYGRAPELKYSGLQGQHAIGLGVIVGTMPDTGFTFNLSAMLTVAFPDIAVSLGVHAFFLDTPKIPGEQRSEPLTGASLNILGIVHVDPTAVAVAIKGSYAIPKVLDLQVPIGAFFPTPLHPAAPGIGFYIRIGADGAQGRTGDPVTITFLPDVLDIRAWAFLMIEEKGIARLGGESVLPDLPGFAIGFGAGADFSWSAGPFTLEIGLKVLLGVGTKPMTMVGLIRLWGEIDLVIVSVGVSAELVMVLRPGNAWMRGKLCGKVSFLFFTVKGCVDVSIGSEAEGETPVPDPPAVRLHLTDRLGRTVATGADSAPATTPGTDGAEDHTCWPDSVPVIEFSHHLVQDWDPASMFRPNAAPAGELWSGSSGLKYAYRVTHVDLVPAPVTDDDPQRSTWWTPTHRPGILDATDVPVGEGEGRFLALLSHDPFGWSRPVTAEGLELAPADPAETIRRSCEDRPVVTRGCVAGHELERRDVDRVFGRGPSATGAFDTSLRVHGLEGFSPLSLTAGVAHGEGAVYTPGAVGAVPAVVDPDGAWFLGRLSGPSGLGLTGSLRLTTTPRVVDPEVRLYVCAGALRHGDEDGRVASRTPGDTAVPFRPADADARCVEADELDPQQPLPQLVDGFTVDDGTGAPPPVASMPDATTGVLVRDRLVVELPRPVPAVEVTAGAFAGEPMVVVALDASGSVVDEWVVEPGRGTATVVLRGDGIVAVECTGGGGEGALVRVCVADGDGVGLGPVLDDARTPLPRVVGIRPDGTVDDLVPTPERVPGLPRGCAVGTWRAPDPDVEYVAVEVLPWLGGTVALVQVCGVSSRIRRIVVENDEHATGLGEDVDGSADPDDPDAQRSDVHVLQPSTRYEVRVRWQWQAWRVPDDGTEEEPPPDPPAGEWVDGGTTTFHFRTAAEVAPTLLPPEDHDDDPSTPDQSPGVEPLDTTVRHEFDPRAVVVYVQDTMPAHPEDPPHFLDDRLKVRWRADHVGQLLERYGRELAYAIVRTELPAGGLHDDDLLLAVPFLVHWVGFHQLSAADRAATGEPADERIVDAMDEAACRTPGPRGPGVAELEPAGLVPDTAYDLVVTAPQSAAPEDAPPVVLRTAFRTSRWASERGLLDALGLPDGDGGIALPHDAVVDGPVPAAPAADLAGDEAFDAVLAAVGLDPWPVPTVSRTTALWQPGADWTLRGVLLESLEPILRPGRLELDAVLVTSRPPGGGPATTTALAFDRANASGARVLCVPPGRGTVLPADRLHELVVRLTAPGPGPGGAPRTTVGRRRLLHLPKLAYQEVR